MTNISIGVFSWNIGTNMTYSSKTGGRNDTFGRETFPIFIDKDWMYPNGKPQKKSRLDFIIEKINKKPPDILIFGFQEIDIIRTSPHSLSAGVGIKAFGSLAGKDWGAFIDHENQTYGDNRTKMRTFQKVIDLYILISQQLTAAAKKKQGANYKMIPTHETCSIKESKEIITDVDLQNKKFGPSKEVGGVKSPDMNDEFSKTNPWEIFGALTACIGITSAIEDFGITILPFYKVATDPDPFSGNPPEIMMIKKAEETADKKKGWKVTKGVVSILIKFGSTEINIMNTHMPFGKEKTTVDFYENKIKTCILPLLVPPAFNKNTIIFGDVNSRSLLTGDCYVKKNKPTCRTASVAKYKTDQGVKDLIDKHKEQKEKAINFYKTNYLSVDFDPKEITGIWSGDVNINQGVIQLDPEIIKQLVVGFSVDIGDDHYEIITIDPERNTITLDKQVNARKPQDIVIYDESEGIPLEFNKDPSPKLGATSVNILDGLSLFGGYTKKKKNYKKKKSRIHKSTKLRKSRKCRNKKKRVRKTKYKQYGGNSDYCNLSDALSLLHTQGPAGTDDGENFGMTEETKVPTCLYDPSDTVNFALTPTKKNKCKTWVMPSSNPNDIIELLLEHDYIGNSPCGNDGAVFKGFSEHKINFLPTYKRDEFTGLFSLLKGDIDIPTKDVTSTFLRKKKTKIVAYTRLPGYADRIFYTSYGGLTSQEYVSLPVTGNDHLPIYCGLTIDTNAQAKAANQGANSEPIMPVPGTPTQNQKETALGVRKRICM